MDTSTLARGETRKGVRTEVNGESKREADGADPGLFGLGNNAPFTKDRGNG